MHSLVDFEQLLNSTYGVPGCDLPSEFDISIPCRPDEVENVIEEALPIAEIKERIKSCLRLLAGSKSIHSMKPTVVSECMKVAKATVNPDRKTIIEIASTVIEANPEADFKATLSLVQAWFRQARAKTKRNGASTRYS
jgi:hypothetical protein